jgi:hypothetical protein
MVLPPAGKIAWPSSTAQLPLVAGEFARSRKIGRGSLHQRPQLVDCQGLPTRVQSLKVFFDPRDVAYLRDGTPAVYTTSKQRRPAGNRKPGGVSSSNLYGKRTNG